MKFNTSENTILVTLYSACLRYNRLLLKWMFVPCQKILSACGSKLWFLIHSKLLWFSDLVILPLYSGLPRGDQVCGPHSSVVLQVNMFSVIISCRSMLTLFYIFGFLGSHFCSYFKREKKSCDINQHCGDVIDSGGTACLSYKYDVDCEFWLILWILCRVWCMLLIVDFLSRSAITRYILSVLLQFFDLAT
jgi:hypothetical protein